MNASIVFSQRESFVLIIRVSAWGKLEARRGADFTHLPMRLLAFFQDKVCNSETPRYASEHPPPEATSPTFSFRNLMRNGLQKIVIFVHARRCSIYHGGLQQHFSSCCCQQHPCLREQPAARADSRRLGFRVMFTPNFGGLYFQESKPMFWFQSSQKVDFEIFRVCHLMEVHFFLC